MGRMTFQKSLWIFWRVCPVCLILFFGSPNARAWSEHVEVTRASLSQADSLKEKKVTVTSFSELCKKLGILEADFNSRILIHKSYRFEFVHGLKEKIGKPVSLLDVLSVYSDEPDWGMDRKLFGADQYQKELWRPEFVLMGGKKEFKPNEDTTPSQAFRHMYWPSWRIKAPKPWAAMGFAHERAQIFLELSRRAKDVGQFYWSARFLANAFHYFQDVAQPFHAAQVPTLKYLWMARPWEILTLKQKPLEVVAAVTHIVSYYHFAFEDYVSTLMRCLSCPEGKELRQSAAQSHRVLGDLVPYFTQPVQGAELLVQFTKNYSSQEATRAGEAAFDFFPAITVPFAELEAKKFLHDSTRWEQVMEKGRHDSPERESYFSVVKEMLEISGQLTRRLVESEITSDPRWK